MLLLLLFLVTFPFYDGWAQKTEVSGKVTDELTGEPIPFANVMFSGTSIGATTNFDGYYKISTTGNYDSVTVSYIGYIPAKKPITSFISQTIHFQLTESVVNLQEVVVRPGKKENPAHAILREVVKNKSRNNKKALQAYEYESYSKIEVDINNISDRLQKQKLVRNIESALDSMEQVRGEDGQVLLPVFISETISQFYFRDNPVLKKEKILKTRIKGVGLEDGSVVSQLLGSSLQDYNFYENWLTFLEKQLVSPIADSWKVHYEYDLTDSLFLGEDFCYRLEVFPKRKQDLAFYGTLWITKEGYALKQLDVSIKETANLNYIDRIYIQQQLIKTEAGSWLPEKTRMVVSAHPAGAQGIGLLTKFYTSTKNPVVNKPYGPKFYQHVLEVAPDAKDHPHLFWEENRHDSLTAEELRVMKMIDTVNQIPSVKRTIGLVKALGSAHFDIGKISIGPFPLFYTFNDVEGHRLGFGLKTNEYFSRKTVFSAFAAYGIGDNRLKYNLSTTYILSRNSWTIAKIGTAKEIEQIGLDPDEMQKNYFFYSFSKWGVLRSPYLLANNFFHVQTDLWKGITARVGLETKDFQPLFPFVFNPTPLATDPNLVQKYSTAEVKTELRFSKNEDFLITDNDRVSLRNSPWPDLTLGYTYGFKDFLGADFEYHKIRITSTQRLNLAVLGTSRYAFEAGHIFNALPYPLLKVHTGNESFFYTSAAFNSMNFLEFVSDSYASFRYIHYFEGLLLNKVPLLKKLKWRSLIQANVLYGGLSQENARLLKASQEALGEGVGSRVFHLSKEPYVEVGYGIENIFRFLRIDFFHRLTYLENPGAKGFGVKVSAQLIL